jgi:hypothetical protein
MIKILICSFLLLIFAGYVPAQNWTSYTAGGSDLVSNDVRAVVLDPFGNKWFATAAGLSRFNGSEWQTYTTADNLISNDIRDLTLEQTAEKLKLWLATAGGVTEMEITEDAASVKNSYTEAGTPLISNDVTAVLADKYGLKWFGTTEGISSFDGSNWSTFLAADSFFITNDDITSAFSLNDAAPKLTSGKHALGKINKSSAYDLEKLNYFGTEGGGATRLIVNGVDAVTTGSPVDATWGSIVSDNVKAVFVDSRREQWFGTDQGVCQFVGSEIRERTDWKNFTTDSVHTAYLVFMYGIPVARDTSYAINGDGLADLSVQAICEDTEGGLWFGTRGGLTRFNRAAWYSFTTADGLVGNNVTDIACDGDGSLWITTTGGVSYLVQTTVPVELAVIPNSYDLQLANYPNPFNNATTINYQLPMASKVEINIYNILGQKVVTLLSRKQQAGYYQLIWNGKNEIFQDVPSGIYLLKLNTGRQVGTHKLMVVK